MAPHPEFAGILREEESFALPDQPALGNRLNGWFDRLMLQSGINWAPSSVLALCMVSALSLGGIVWVLQEHFLTAAAATLLGAGIPLTVVTVLRARRQRQINRQLPAMIDELARAAKTGRSLESCLAMVAADVAAPLGTELQRCQQKLTLGIDLEGALAELPQRTGVVGASVLVIALSVHRQTGGDLIQVLDRLAQTLRQRMQFQGRLRAATAASRATATLMIVLPLGIVGIFSFRDPEYLSQLMTSPWGFRITMAALLLELVGAVWVLRILKQSQKI